VISFIAVAVLEYPAHVRLPRLNYYSKCKTNFNRGYLIPKVIPI